MISSALWNSFWSARLRICAHSATRAWVRSALMLDEEAWGSVRAPVVYQGQISVQTNPVLSLQRWQTMSSWSWQGHRKHKHIRFLPLISHHKYCEIRKSSETADFVPEQTWSRNQKKEKMKSEGKVQVEVALQSVHKHACNERACLNPLSTVRA